MASLIIKKNNLVRKYGQEFLTDFNALLEGNSKLNLTRIAEKYNFSKENARCLFKSLFGIPYTKIYKCKILKKEYNKADAFIQPDTRLLRADKGRLSGRLSGRYLSVIAKKKIYDLCKNKKFKIEPMHSFSGIDFIINKHRVKVTVCSKSRTMIKNSGIKYYHFAMSKLSRERSDFLICLIYSTEEIYIIPKEKLPIASGFRCGFFITDKNSDLTEQRKVCRYEEYLNRWDLLIY